ncbi:MAG: alpha/beta hydrolase, partial [Candidatus Eremiobacteraeota bacterium]|nr:alpha/beta hydrolase [Candidatus Eremiobacteraeota bacterium]
MSLERPIDLGEGATVLETWGTSGPAMVCVHGITSSRRSWTRLGERLAPHCRVFAYDQRGHGDAATAPGPMTLERGVADLERVVAAVGGRV